LPYTTLFGSQGNARAQNNLGVMYENGRGVTMDQMEGLAWYYVAKSNSPPEEVAKDLDSAISFLENRLGSSAALAVQRRAREIAAAISGQPAVH
jgi:hypothetical protein